MQTPTSGFILVELHNSKRWSCRVIQHNRHANPPRLHHHSPRGSPRKITRKNANTQVLSLRVVSILNARSAEMTTAPPVDNFWGRLNKHVFTHRLSSLVRTRYVQWISRRLPCYRYSLSVTTSSLFPLLFFPLCLLIHHLLGKLINNSWDDCPLLSLKIPYFQNAANQPPGW